jgi:nucleoside-diphosphate-sugar epimerase
METILVTGAGGYVGSNAACYFAEKGFRVKGVVHRRVSQRLKDADIETIPADLTDATAIGSLFSEPIDYVVHIAARTSEVGRDAWFREANYEAVKRLAATAMARGVRRFVYLSTADVYGLHDFHGETED